MSTTIVNIQTWICTAINGMVLPLEITFSRHMEFYQSWEPCVSGQRMSLQEIVNLMHKGEYGTVISLLESEVSNKTRSPLERAEYCKWLAECYNKMEDYETSGDWYLEAVKQVLSQQIDMGLKAEQALPFCEKALESYELGADIVDILEAAKLERAFWLKVLQLQICFTTDHL